MKDLNEMLSRTPELVDGIIEIAHQRKWLDLSVATIKFAQCVVQGLSLQNHSLEQLPGITAAEVKTMVTSATAVSSLKEFLKLPDSAKQACLSSLKEEEQKEVLRVCGILPNLSVETQLFVEEDDEEDDEEDAATASRASKKNGGDDDVIDVDAVTGYKIYEQDLVTLRITLTRNNLPAPAALPASASKKAKAAAKKAAASSAAGTAPPVFAPLFPKTLKENWWIVLTDRLRPDAGDGKVSPNTNANIYAFEKVGEQTRTVVHEVRFMAPQKAGEYEMQLQVLSDCYMGIDHVVPIIFTVLPASQLPEFKMHPEDQALDNEPTLFEQVMAANADDESSDEEDDEEEEEEEKKNKDKKAAVSSQGGKKSSVIVEDASDSEEDN
jgi:translocation protein SEC63